MKYLDKKGLSTAHISPFKDEVIVPFAVNSLKTTKLALQATAVLLSALLYNLKYVDVLGSYIT
jgi:hypothetical protein